jgi:DNA-binding Xre family transcriptional regulator
MLFRSLEKEATQMDAKQQVRQLCAPDKARLAELLILAKGPDRTMLQFSKDAGVSSATLSRIGNGKVKEAVTLDVLFRIYEASCDESSVSLSDLLDANGMVVVDGTAGETEKSAIQLAVDKLKSSNRERRVGLGRQAKNAVIKSLVDRGVSVSSVTEEQSWDRRQTDFGTTAPFDFGLVVSDTRVPLWFFTLVDDGAEGCPVGAGWEFTQVSHLFFLDGWRSPTLDGQVNSLVFTKRLAYESFYLTYQGGPLNTPISLILVDLDAETVIEERWLSNPWRLESLFDKPNTDTQGAIEVLIDEEPISFLDLFSNDEE